MIINDMYDNGSVRFVVSAASDDGRIALTNGMADTCGLTDTTTGRHMWHGVYQGADGYYSMHGERVPAEVWASACKLMREVTAHNDAQSAEMRQRAEDKLNRMAESIPDQMLDMDRADSDL